MKVEACNVTIEIRKPNGKMVKKRTGKAVPVELNIEDDDTLVLCLRLKPAVEIKLGQQFQLHSRFAAEGKASFVVRSASGTWAAMLHGADEQSRRAVPELVHVAKSALAGTLHGRPAEPVALGGPAGSPEGRKRRPLPLSEMSPNSRPPAGTRMQPPAGFAAPAASRKSV